MDPSMQRLRREVEPPDQVTSRPGRPLRVYSASTPLPAHRSETLVR